MNPAAAPDAAPIEVDEASLRRSLEAVRKAPIDPKKGLFGPESMFWEVNKHTLVYFLGAVQSVQMQLCHPWIGTAVFDHSKIMTDPRRRAQLTYSFLWSFIYGDLDMVMKRAMGLYKVHGRVQGTIDEKAGTHAAGEHYQANEVNALLWVHVTAFLCRVRLYEILVRPLSTAEKDRFVNEAKLYAMCFGIPDTAHPQDWQEVEDYVAAMDASDTLARNEKGMKIRLFLEKSIPRPLRQPVWNFICMQLPERTRQLLDLPADNAANRASALRVGKVLGFIQRTLPAKLAYVPAYHEAMARIAGKGGPDWLTARINKAILGTPRLVS